MIFISASFAGFGVIMIITALFVQRDNSGTEVRLDNSSVPLKKVYSFMKKWRTEVYLKLLPRRSVHSILLF